MKPCEWLFGYLLMKSGLGVDMAVFFEFDNPGRIFETFARSFYYYFM